MDFSIRKLLCLAALAALTSGCGRKLTGDDHFAKGLAYYKDGKFDSAASQFEGALASMHTNALALNFLGVCRLQQGETEAGMQNLRDAVQLDPTYVPARYNLALAQLEQDHPDDAMTNLRQVVQSPAAPADSYYQLGLAYMQLSAWDKAEEALKRYLQSNPKSADTLNCLGIVAARRNDFAQAKHWFEQCTAADTRFATAYLNLASLENHQLGLKKEALSHYEAYVDLLPNSHPREDVRLAMLQINQELTAAAKQPVHPTEAPAKPEQPRNSPAQPPAPTAAVAPATPQPQPVAPKPAPSAPVPVVTASPISSPPPPPPPPPVRKIRTPVGVKILKPGNRTKALVYFNGGVKYQEQNDTVNAIVAYARAIAIDPTFPKSYYNQAIAYRAIGQPDRALDNYELALVADPNYADARFNYAILLQEQGYLDDAVTQFERVLVDNPNDATSHFCLGRLYARNPATYDRARAHYQLFLKLSPNSLVSRDVRRWLDQNR
jgi:tetratricopeptide (TPR) repeat protein